MLDVVQGRMVERCAMDAKQLMAEAAFFTDRALGKFMALRSDTITLKQAQDIQDCLSSAASRMTAVVRLVAGSPPPKTGE